MKLRNMARAELPLVLDWAAAEGWNPGLDDAGPFFDTDPGGFFVAEADGAPVAAISVVNHSETLAFLGLYLCLPAYRGQGIGWALWRHALAHAGARTVGLDGVPAQQENYRRSGFAGAGETMRFEGILSPRPLPDCRAPAPEEIAALIDLDAQATGYRKAQFMRHWLVDSPTRRTLVYAPKGKADGFATIRQCRKGAKIGPLVAPDTATAKGLMHALAALTPDGPVVVDVPGTDESLIDHCRAQGMACSFTTARMYRGPAPSPGSGVHTVATLELG